VNKYVSGGMFEVGSCGSEVFGEEEVEKARRILTTKSHLTSSTPKFTSDIL
jgi:hypothetical protein